MSRSAMLGLDGLALVRVSMDFKVGDKAVYPGHGVGVIKAVETMDFDGFRQTMYVLKILDNGMTIKVPIHNASALGMRPVISQVQVDKVYEVLRDRDVPADTQTWNRRYREYLNKIQTGDPIEVAKVLRDLALLRQDKNLSFGERKMYDQAHSLLVQEVSVAKDTDEKTIQSEIEAIFSA
jgi:CarD family transcriptional regulator